MNYNPYNIAEKHLQKYLKKVTHVLNISNSNYCIKSGSEKGDNFIGIIYRILIKGETVNKVPIEFPIIAKVPPKDEALREQYHISYFFPQEHQFYSKIVPVFKDFLHSHKKRFENVPECYFSSKADHEEAIFLEDLQPKGYVMLKNKKQMDFQHTALALRAIGRFHALSFALRDQKPDIFSTKISNLKEAFLRPEVISDPKFDIYLQEFKKLISTELSKLDQKYAERFSKFMNDVLSHLEWSYDGNNAEPYSVLCHGDLWSNNMLFKYSEDSVIPLDIYLLDFQLSRYASPATEIFYILFYSCNHELRNKHFDELIKVYHKSLSDYLAELGSDPKQLFPFDELINQLIMFGKNVAGLIMILLYYFVTEGDNVRDFGDGNIDVEWMRAKIFGDQFWNNNLISVFKDLIDKNYI